VEFGVPFGVPFGSLRHVGEVETVSGARYLDFSWDAMEVSRGNSFGMPCQVKNSNPSFPEGAACLSKELATVSWAFCPKCDF
jgi:hypothetical protein